MPKSAGRMRRCLPRWAMPRGSRLSETEPRSALVDRAAHRGSRLTRQAVTKHLRVLEQAGLVRGVHRGRENQFEFDPDPILEAKDTSSKSPDNPDQTLTRLKAFVENKNST